MPDKFEIIEPIDDEVDAFREETGLSFGYGGQYVAFKYNGDIISLLEYDVKGKDFPETLVLYAAATRDDYRGKGIARKLIDWTLDAYDTLLGIEAPMIITYEGAGLVEYAKKQLERRKKERNACK